MCASSLLSGCGRNLNARVTPEHLRPCEDLHAAVEELIANTPLVAEHRVFHCDEPYNDSFNPRIVAKVSLSEIAQTSDAVELIQHVQSLPSGRLTGSQHEGIDVDVSWQSQGTTLTIYSKAPLQRNENLHCLNQFDLVNRYAGHPHVERIIATCEGITVDHGDLSAFPSEFVAQRSDFPDTLGKLEETFTIGKWWKIIIHPHNGWEIPTDYPFDNLLKTIEANNTNWRNVDDHWNPTPTIFNVRSYADIPGMNEEEEHATEETKNLDPSFSSITIDTLNGTDPGLDQEAAQRIGNFLNTHPGIKDARICGISERGLFHGNGVPYYCYYWPSQEFGRL